MFSVRGRFRVRGLKMSFGQYKSKTSQWKVPKIKKQTNVCVCKKNIRLFKIFIIIYYINYINKYINSKVTHTHTHTLVIDFTKCLLIT